METVNFNFILESQGKLANVEFFPEHEPTTIRLETDSSRKVWRNEEFALLVQNPFEYKLRVFGVSGTKWRAKLNIIKSNGQILFIEWQGETGDTRRNVSIRTKPERNIP